MTVVADCRERDWAAIISRCIGRVVGGGNAAGPVVVAEDGWTLRWTRCVTAGRIVIARIIIAAQIQGEIGGGAADVLFFGLH